MRTLATQKNPKTKPTKDTKKPSKKMIKTTFMDPFYYKIQTLDYEDSLLLENKLCSYFQKLRIDGKFKAPIVRQKFIKFDSSQKDMLSKSQIKPPLIDLNLYVGIKMNLKMVKKTNEKLHPALVIIFYEQKKHDLLVQLLCAVQHKKVPYILSRDNNKIAEKYGVKTLTALGIANQQHSLFKQLFQLSSKCMIQIPWLVQTNWQVLRANKI